MSVSASPGGPPRSFRTTGSFIRAAKSAEPAREMEFGQWGMMPWFAEAARLAYSTNNARLEELAPKTSFKQPWTHGRRCIIPVASFDEPNGESGSNERWRFRRADGKLWGLAGLWNTWTDPASGEIVES